MLIPSLMFCYALIWIAFVSGYCLISQKSEPSKRFEKFLWNSRIEKMQYPPFTRIMKLAERRNPVIGLWVIITNAGMVLVELLLGILIVGPIFLSIQGFMVGALIAQADKKTKVFSVFVLVFEFGAFASACGIGLILTYNQLMHSTSIIQGFKEMNETGIIWIPIILLILNGIFEGSGVFFNIEGVPGIKAVREKIYK
jgi:hypothetical protein